ncbi:hypothetical protein ACTJJ7_03900 [Phyllobacterium sp. 22229]|uniref:hypothetical protein n=1 Tax=Phyllobacterium sp. 22229 TaxID=3453895 RepID=UPI003F8280E4
MKSPTAASGTGEAHGVQRKKRSGAMLLGISGLKGETISGLPTSKTSIARRLLALDQHIAIAWDDLMIESTQKGLNKPSVECNGVSDIIEQHHFGTHSMAFWPIM